MMKRFFSMFLALLLVFSCAAACAEEYYHFEIVSKGFQATYWQAVQKGAREEADRLNREAGYEMITMNYTGPDSEADI